MEGERTMSTESTRQFFKRYMEAMMSGDKSPENVARYVDDPVLQEHIAVFEAAFPDYKLDAEDVIVEDDKFVLRATFRGVHRGDFQGMAPTGREVSIPIFVIYRVDRDKIVEHWMSADQLGLMQQLGAVPTPA
jgi:predicted ester cyclase